MLPLRGLRNLLACFVGKTLLIFEVELYDSYVSNGESANSFPGFSPTNPTLRRAGRENPGNEVGESACPRVYPPDMIHGVNKCMSFRELRNFLACLVFYKSTCILGTGQ